MTYALNYPNRSCAEAILKIALRNLEKTAYKFLFFKKDYRQFAIQVITSALAFQRAGIQENDHIMICLPNVPEALFAFYGANLIGATVVFVHPLSSEGELEYFIADSKPKMIVTMKRFTDKFKVDIPIIDNWKKFTRGIHNLKIELPLSDAMDRVAAIMYSGGTTGLPKGVMLTNFNINALAMQAAEAADCLEPGGKMLAIMPIFHGYGLGVGVHTALLKACCVVLVPRFTPKSCAKLIKSINYFAGVPTLFEALLREPSLEHADLSQLRGVFCGGDSLSVDLKRRFDDFLAKHGAPVRLREGYGMTESVTATCLTPKDPAMEREGSVGLPCLDTYYKVYNGSVPENDNPDGLEVGELCVRGPTVMKGYLGKPEETAAVIKTHEDGYEWLHTGDIGSVDEDEYVRFLGRIKRVIMTSGYSVYPSQIEQALNLCEVVRDSSVIGVPHPLKMQVPKAFVILNPGVDRSAAEAQIRTHLDKHVAKYALPKDIVFIDAFPKTKLGKVDVLELEKM